MLARCAEHGLEKILESRGCNTDRAVGGAVVEADLVAAGIVNDPAGKDDVRHIAGSLVGGERSEDPVGEASQNARRVVEIEQGEADPVDLAGDGLFDAVVEEQPAVLGSERRRADADPQRVPPGARAWLQHLLGGAPADEVVRAGEEDLTVRAAVLCLRAVEKQPASVDSVRKECCVLVFGLSDDPVALDSLELLGGGEEDGRSGGAVGGGAKPAGRGGRQPMSTTEVVIRSAATSMARSVGTQVGRAILRNVLGSIVKGR